MDYNVLMYVVYIVNVTGAQSNAVNKKLRPEGAVVVDQETYTIYYRYFIVGRWHRRTGSGLYIPSQIDPTGSLRCKRACVHRIL